jgi:hypothetical protein
MPTGATAAGYGDGYARLQLIKRCSRHGLNTGNTRDGDTEDQCKGRKPDHFFLLWFVEFLFCRALGSILTGAATSNTRLCAKLA